MENFTIEKRQLCDIQGRLFELALKQGYDCPMFIEAFMSSKAAAALDDVYDRLQWAGEEYILEELSDEVDDLERVGTAYTMEVMYWTGYTYRYWHYYTNENSKNKPYNVFLESIDLAYTILDFKFDFLCLERENRQQEYP